MVAILAAPPACRPPSRMARSMKACPPPVCSRSAPKSTKAAITVAATPVSIPQMPRSPRKTVSVI